MVGTVSAVGHRLLKGSCHETASSLGHKDLGLFPELKFQFIVSLMGNVKHFGSIRQRFHIRKYIILMFKKPHCDIAFGKMLPFIVAIVDGRRNPRYGFLKVLAVRHAHLPFIRFRKTFGYLAYQSHLGKGIILVAGYNRHSQHPG